MSAENFDYAFIVGVQEYFRSFVSFLDVDIKATFRVTSPTDILISYSVKRRIFSVAYANGKAQAY